MLRNGSWRKYRYIEARCYRSRLKSHVTFFWLEDPKMQMDKHEYSLLPTLLILEFFFQRLLRFSLVSTPRAIIKRSSANPKFRRKILWKDLRAQHSWQAGVEGHFVLDLHWTPGEGELQKICRKTKMQTSIYRTVLTVSLFSKWLGKF